MDCDESAMRLLYTNPEMAPTFVTHRLFAPLCLLTNGVWKLVFEAQFKHVPEVKEFPTLLSVNRYYYFLREGFDKTYPIDIAKELKLPHRVRRKRVIRKRYPEREQGIFIRVDFAIQLIEERERRYAEAHPIAYRRKAAWRDYMRTLYET